MQQDLTSPMKKALLHVGFGVRKYHDGAYYSIDDHERINIKSLNALFRRDLIDWRGIGGATHQIHLCLTAKGEKLFESLRADKG